MVICLELGADLRMAQLMPVPLTVSCFSKIQIGFAFLVPAHPGSPGKGPLNGCVCVISEIIICSICKQVHYGGDVGQHFVHMIDEKLMMYCTCV